MNEKDSSKIVAEDRPQDIGMPLENEEAVWKRWERSRILQKIQSVIAEELEVETLRIELATVTLALQQAAGAINVDSYTNKDDNYIARECRAVILNLRTPNGLEALREFGLKVASATYDEVGKEGFMNFEAIVDRVMKGN